MTQLYRMVFEQGKMMMMMIFEQGKKAAITLLRNRNHFGFYALLFIISAD